MQPVALAARVQRRVPLVHGDLKPGPEQSLRQAEPANARARHGDLHRTSPVTGRFIASSDRRTPIPVRLPYRPLPPSKTGMTIAGTTAGTAAAALTGSDTASSSSTAPAASRM